jgi:hypothetical protein
MSAPYPLQTQTDDASTGSKKLCESRNRGLTLGILVV